MWLVVKSHLVKNWKAYSVAAILALNIVLAGTAYYLFDSLQTARNELNKANNVIQAKVDEIQEFDAKMSLAESDLRTQEDLIKKYKAEIDAMESDFKNLTAKYDLKLKERDSTISYWKGKAKGGTQVVTTTGPDKDSGTFETIVEVDVKEVCGGKTLAYSWQDEDLRFHLQDPDISTSGDETFEYKQYVSVKGYVFSDETGQIQIKRIEIREVVRKEQNGDVTYVPVSDQNVRLVDSKFEYINSIENTKGWTDIFGLRAMALFDTQLYPGIGVEVINLGRWIDWANVGLYGKMAFNTHDGLTRLQESTIGAGVAYHLVPPLINTNLAIGLSINTPFNDLGRMMLSVDAIFYLTNW